jgi:hypothetical protein
MNTDEAFKTLAKAYAIPIELIQAQISKIKNESGSTVTNFALAAWLRECAQKYERGLGYYGKPTHIDTLSEISLYRLSADRLEEATKKANPELEGTCATA